MGAKTGRYFLFFTIGGLGLKVQWALMTTVMMILINPKTYLRKTFLAFSNKKLKIDFKPKYWTFSTVQFC